MRVGFGYDSHRFSPSPARALVLCGVVFPGHPGLEGHSDADCPVHALIDAMLGAACLGDIGTAFPDTDPALEGISSLSLLSRTSEMIRQCGYSLVNADITIVCESPKIAPAARAMRERVAEACGVPLTALSVKGKTDEGMGFAGRGEGIKSYAVCLLE